MLASQFETLEEPQDALVEDITRTPQEIVQNIIVELTINKP
jgi:gluconate kinase